MKKLDKEYVKERYKLIEEFLWEKRGFWANLPLLYYINNGKTTVPTQNTALLRDKMYPLDYDYSPLYVSCCDVKIYSFYQNRMRFEPIDDRQKAKLVGEFLGEDSKELDGEYHYDYYQTMINKTKYNQFADDIWKNSKNKKWIIDAIAYDIPINYEAYCRHFDNSFVITEEEYDYLVSELIMEYAKSKLIGKAHQLEVFA
jgi:hypothetical protein